MDKNLLICGDNLNALDDLIKEELKLTTAFFRR
jgi:hypothetical protein